MSLPVLASLRAGSTGLLSWGTYDTVEAAQLFANGKLGAPDAAIVDEKQQHINELEEALATVVDECNEVKESLMDRTVADATVQQQIDAVQNTAYEVLNE